MRIGMRGTRAGVGLAITVGAAWAWCAGSIGCTDADGAAPSGGSCVAIDAGSCPGTYALAALSDYNSSALASFDRDSGTFKGGVDLGKDSTIAESNGHSFWIGRDVDTIFPLDSCGGDHGSIAVRPATQTTSINPQDVAVASDCALWIPMYNDPTLQIREATGALRASIDLSSYDSDGNPNASAIDIVTTSRGEEAFLALERLNNRVAAQPSEQPSEMVIFDVASATATKAVPLAGRNPLGQPARVGQYLYMADSGNIGSSACSCDADHEPFGGVERFDTEAEAGLLIATESVLGGSVIDVAVSDDGECGAALIADPSADNRTSMVPFDPKATTAPSGPMPAKLIGPTAGYDLEGIAWVHRQDATGATREELLVGDRGGHGPYAIHVFVRGAGCALTTAAADDFAVQLPPEVIRAVSH